VCVCFLVFFFFQAEDGIRDFHVTGVQTCALPICHGLSLSPTAKLMERTLPPAPNRIAALPLRARSCAVTTRASPFRHGLSAVARSEERRVGKECRARWPLDRYKKQKIRVSRRRHA